MVKLILTIFTLFFATTGNTEPIDKYFHSLNMKRTTELWIDKLQPNRSTDTDIIANHLLMNAAANNIPVEILVGLITVESRFNTRATSSHGAKGLTQVMPRYHKAKIHGRDIFDPRVGIEVGSLILRDCLDKHSNSYRKALGCYSGSKGKQAVKYYQLVLKESNRFTQYLTLQSKYAESEEIQIKS
jgi:soluble lytic murein transglycosylase-like protein